MYDYATVRIPIPGVRSNPVVNKAGAIFFLLMSATVFALYSPLAYGNAWTKTECNRVKLFNTWDWDCNNFLDSVSVPSPGKLS
jgi:dolichyl-phosphate-mannose-protein mannosyltransferase